MAEKKMKNTTKKGDGYSFDIIKKKMKSININNLWKKRINTSFNAIWLLIPMGLLGLFFATTSSSRINAIISLCIITLTIFSIIKKQNYKNEIVSVGIFGTFLGIIIGLYNFDINYIDQSIINLLEGLKIAFFTSGLGLFCSILLSIFLKANDDSLSKMIKNQEKILRALRNPLDKFAQNSNEQIIKALQEIVNDFNSSLTSEFGENIKSLNSAIENLNRWQRDYKNELATIQESLKRVTKGLDETSHQFASLGNNVNTELKKAVDITKESLDLLLKEANGR